MNLETLALVSKLAPTAATLRRLHLASYVFKLRPATLYEVRCRYRQLSKYDDKKYSGYGKYRWELPTGRPDGLRLTLNLKSMQPFAVAYYVNGRRHGMRDTWIAGRLASRVTYNHGEKHGARMTWYHDGALRSCSEYVHDKRHGEYREYDGGRLVCSHTYNSGVLQSCNVCRHALGIHQCYLCE